MTVDTETEARILQKVEYVDRAVTLLTKKQSLDEAEYLQDREQQAIVEREFQTAIEACIDIAELLITSQGETVPPTNAEKFARLNTLEILSQETSARMQDAAGFRNVLTHNYGQQIDDKQVYWHLQEDLHWFPAFLREVRTALGE